MYKIPRNAKNSAEWAKFRGMGKKSAECIKFRGMKIFPWNVTFRGMEIAKSTKRAEFHGMKLLNLIEL